jgi:hypothetical protein
METYENNEKLWNTRNINEPKLKCNLNNQVDTSNTFLCKQDHY